jgi:hypothetical protein
MQQKGVHPNFVTYVGVLNACAIGVAFEKVGVFMIKSFKVDGI